MALRRRDLRAILLGLVVAVPLLAHRYVLGPYLDRTAELAERIVLEGSLLSRERDLIDDVPGLDARIQRLAPRLDLASAALLAGESRVEREGALAGYLAERARESGLLLQRSEGRDPGAADGLGGEGNALVSTSVLVQTLGDLEGVVRFLHALETGPLAARVERLQVQPSPLRTADPAEAQPLQMGLLVTAFSLGEAALPGAAVAEASAGGSR